VPGPVRVLGPEERKDKPIRDKPEACNVLEPCAREEGYIGEIDGEDSLEGLDLFFYTILLLRVITNTRRRHVTYYNKGLALPHYPHR
jgi:hypothetical protein